MLECFCNCHNFTILTTKDYLYKGLNTFNYNICNNCGSFYLIDYEEISNNYNTNYYSIVNKVQRKPNIFRSLRFTSNSLFSKFLRIIKPLSLYDKIVTDFIKLNNPIVLDFGSGTSTYIKFLNSINLLKTQGYSYDPYSKDTDTINDLKNIPFQNINLIISNQAFEHLPDLKHTIEILYNLTKHDCNLIFSVPVVGSVLTSFREYSFTLQAPDHISILSLHSWMKLIVNSKWKVVSIYEDIQSQKTYYDRSNDLKLKYNKTISVKLSNNSISDNMIFHLSK